MRPDRSDVGAEAGLALRLVDFVASIEIGVQGAFGVDHQLSAARQPHQDVRAQSSVLTLD